MTPWKDLAPRSPTDLAVAPRRRAARWALGLGALSVVVHMVQLLNLASARAARRDASARHVVVDSPAVTVDALALSLSGIAFLAAGIFACVWLVRAYREGREANATLKSVSDAWLWVMWLVPGVQWIAPVLRFKDLVRAVGVSGIRGWLVGAWAAVWIPVDYFQRDLRTSVPLDGSGDRALILWTVGFGLAFALWAALVITIDRALDQALVRPLDRQPATPTPQVVSSGAQGGLEGLS